MLSSTDIFVTIDVIVIQKLHLCIIKKHFKTNSPIPALFFGIGLFF